MLANIPCTEGTQVNVQKVGWAFSLTRSPWGRTWSIMGSPILCTTWPENVIEADDGPLKRYKISMVDLGMYVFKELNTGKITPEESFTNAYIKELYDS